MKGEIITASDSVHSGTDDLLVTVGSLMTETKNEVSAIQRRAGMEIIRKNVPALSDVIVTLGRKAEEALTKRLLRSSMVWSQLSPKQRDRKALRPST
ncbi:MAG TPA: hypothetical protein VFG09_02720 [Thermodesulfovibrionales bacterium]|nr:hypothetical protein [Thermodesulfovibrionales bacterium]